MIRRPPRSTQSRSSAASDVYKRQEVRVKRCGKSAPRWRQRQRQGKPHREQDQIGVAGRAFFFVCCTHRETCGVEPIFRPATRVDCLRRLVTNVPDEWPSRRGNSPNRTRLTGRLVLFCCRSTAKLARCEPVAWCGASRLSSQSHHKDRHPGAGRDSSKRIVV